MRERESRVKLLAMQPRKVSQESGARRQKQKLSPPKRSKHGGEERDREKSTRLVGRLSPLPRSPESPDSFCLRPDAFNSPPKTKRPFYYLNSVATAITAVSAAGAVALTRRRLSEGRACPELEMCAVSSAGAVASTRRRLSEGCVFSELETGDNSDDERYELPLHGNDGSRRSWKNRLRARRIIMIRVLVIVLAALMAIALFMTIPLINKPIQIPDIWAKPDSKGYKQCVERSGKHNKTTATDGYLLAHANGGLNKMRLGISDMVAIAKMMNATLVIPSLDQKSRFKDLFDAKHFIDVLKNDVPIVKSLPPEYAAVRPFRKAPVPWSKSSYYKSFTGILHKYKVVEFTNSNSRLANNALPTSIQKLRCLTNYKALRYTPGIEELGNRLVDRLRNTSDHYLALHLRYEKEMLASTGCDHSLTTKEVEELMDLRDKETNGEKKRKQGKCPLTPRETSLFLRAMGYPSTANIYIAAGESYGANSMEALRADYPNIHTHNSLATVDELLPFLMDPNKLAALDYIVALKSDVFVYTYEDTMAKAVQGHRRFKGFLKTINPDRQRLVKLIDQLDKGAITWEKFEQKVKKYHVKRLSSPYERTYAQEPKLEENFYANPFFDCFCRKANQQNQ